MALAVLAWRVYRYHTLISWYVHMGINILSLCSHIDIVWYVCIHIYVNGQDLPKYDMHTYVYRMYVCVTITRKLTEW